ncbi:MAG: DNA alkylation repair protein [Chlorobi bacterium]|nr:DNA alkylation repair protein [Chlorobiota bacterium]
MPADKKIKANDFIKKLKTSASAEDLKKLSRYFKTGKGEYGEGDKFIGVRMGTVFKFSQEFIEMPPGEIEKMLKSPIHEIRAAALSVMSKQARRKKTPENRRKELFELYLSRHQKINNWDLVDVSCVYVVGGYLFDKPRSILYNLAKSKNLWERRTSIVSTAYFIKRGDLDDTYKIAKMLLNDKEDLIHKATGWLLRYAGDRNFHRLTGFLDNHAATMPRTALRYALEHFDKNEREYYMGLKKNSIKK